MFKNIGNLFEKKIIILSATQDKTIQIKQILKSFLENKFGDNLKGFLFEISYDKNNNSLTITSSNKIIANELTLQLVDLHEALQKDNIKLTRILIR